MKDEKEKLKKISIKPGCIACGACEYIAPEVFYVADISHVKQNADLEKNEQKIKEAIANCPVGVIEYEDRELKRK